MFPPILACNVTASRHNWLNPYPGMPWGSYPDRSGVMRVGKAENRYSEVRLESFTRAKIYRSAIQVQTAVRSGESEGGIVATAPRRSPHHVAHRTTSLPTASGPTTTTATRDHRTCTSPEDGGSTADGKKLGPVMKWSKPKPMNDPTWNGKTPNHAVYSHPQKLQPFSSWRCS